MFACKYKWRRKGKKRRRHSNTQSRRRSKLLTFSGTLDQYMQGSVEFYTIFQSSSTGILAVNSKFWALHELRGKIVFKCRSKIIKLKTFESPKQERATQTKSG